MQVYVPVRPWICDPLIARLTWVIPCTRGRARTRSYRIGLGWVYTVNHTAARSGHRWQRSLPHVNYVRHAPNTGAMKSSSEVMHSRKDVVRTSSCAKSNTSKIASTASMIHAHMLRNSSYLSLDRATTALLQLCGVLPVCRVMLGEFLMCVSSMLDAGCVPSASRRNAKSSAEKQQGAAT